MGSFRPRRSVAGLVALSFASGLAVMSVLPRDGGGSQASAFVARAPRDVTAVAAGPRTFEDGIPAGFARTREGAVAAAVAYVRTGQAFLGMDLLAAEEAARRLAADAAAESFATETVKQLRSVHATLAGGSGPIVFRQAAVAYRVEAFDQDRTRVAVWNVGILTRAGVASPQAGWAISTLELVWERGDWRIWSETIVPGPAPVLNDSTAPATAEEFVSSLDGFVDLGGAE